VIEQLKPYPTYRESGLPWLGRIPATWAVARTKTRFRLSIEKSGKKHGKELLSIYSRIGVRPRKDLEARGNKATTTDNYWVVRKGDIISNKLLAWMGAIGVSHYDGVTSPAYDILRPVQPLESDYYHHLFRTELYLQQFKIRSRGIMDMRLRLYFDQLGQIPIPCPSLEEQRLMVRFLRHVNGRINQLVLAKKKLISLLNEQKHTITYQVVTRGLNSTASFKQSNIPWLGSIPEHWALKKIREVATVINGYPFDSSRFSNIAGHPLIRIRDLNQAQTVALYNGPFVESARVEPGDVLIGMDGEFNVGSWAGCQPALLNQRMCCIRGRNKQLSNFLQCVLPYPLKMINEMTASTTVKHLASAEVERIVFGCPPDSEQEAIVNYVHNATKSIAIAISRLNREINFLHEYQKRLVVDIVTGKLDTRQAAEKLSVEVEILAEDIAEEIIEEEEVVDAE